MRRFTSFVALILGVAACVPTGSLAAAPATAPSEGQTATLAPLRAFRSFTRQNSPGLPQSSVSAIVQDAEGVLWFGTRDGLASYDGRAAHDVSSDPGVPPIRIVNALAHRATGGLYVGGSEGLSVTDGQRWWRSGRERTVMSVIEGAPGVAWVVDEQGRAWSVREGEDAEWQPVALPSGTGPAVAVARAPDRSIWIVAQSALVHVNNAGTARQVGVVPHEMQPTSLLVDHSGRPRVGTASGEVLTWTPEGIPNPPEPSCGGQTAVSALVADSRGRLWAGCEDGHVSVSVTEGHWSVWGTEEGVPVGARVLSLAVDREGSLWIGHNTVGAMQLVSEAWQHRVHWTGTEGQVGEPVFGISRTPGGDILMAVFNRGIWRWDGRRMAEVGGTKGLIEGFRYAVEPEPGVLWVGGASGLYESRQGATFRRMLTPPLGAVTSIHRSPEGTWFAATSAAGIWARRQGIWTPEQAINARLPHQNVRGLAWLPNGEMWVATPGGVAVVSGDQVTIERLTGSPAREVYANCVLALADGDIWVGGMGGLWIRRLGRWEHHPPGEGLPGRTIYSLALAPDGAVWAGGSAGVGRFSGGRWRVYTQNDGLLDAECDLNGLAVLPDGRVLVGTVGSLAVFDPSVPAPPSPPLRVFWREVPTVGPDGTAHLPVGQRSLRLRWSAPWLKQAPVEFRARTSPGQADFSAPTSIGELQLDRLGPGTSIIEVMAHVAGSDAGTWTVPLSVRVHVDPYLYEQWWARLIGIVGLLSLIPLGVRLRTRQVERQAQQLRERVKAAVAEVKTLTGLIPICASCKRIRDDRGAWNRLETYVSAHSQAAFSHGICPECERRLYPE